MPKCSCGRCVNMLAVLLGKLHIALVNLPMTLFSFIMSGLEKVTT